ncbi:MAG TPA: hypothetical protein VFB60_11775 [Ktedonobacteraceae bacterium]|nr:hypothetical protein [Ktedonobacteraceae bacterium]
MLISKNITRLTDEPVPSRFSALGEKSRPGPDAWNAMNHPRGHPLEEPATLLHEVTLGVHHLCILSDQSIIVRGEQDETEEAAQEFHLDATETYRLMQCLREVFQQPPMRPEKTHAPQFN